MKAEEILENLGQQSIDNDPDEALEKAFEEAFEEVNALQQTVLPPEI